MTIHNVIKDFQSPLVHHVCIWRKFIPEDMVKICNYLIFIFTTTKFCIRIAYKRFWRFSRNTECIILFYWSWSLVIGHVLGLFAAIGFRSSSKYRLLSQTWIEIFYFQDDAKINCDAFFHYKKRVHRFPYLKSCGIPKIFSNFIKNLPVRGILLFKFRKKIPLFSIQKYCGIPQKKFRIPPFRVWPR